MTDTLGLRKQREANKTKLATIIKYVEKLDQEPSIDDLKVRLGRVETLMAEFTVIENKIFFADPTQESDYSYEEDYYKAVSILNSLIRNKELEEGYSSPNASRSKDYTANSVGTSSEIKLPKINIPPFSGEYTEWQSFYDLFSCTVHSSGKLNPVQKFQYLKGLLRGEAAMLLRHMSITEANYVEALSKLKERYDRKKPIINSFIRTFVEQPSISTASANAIKRLMDTSDEVIRGLKALGENAESRDVWLIYLLVNKLDDRSKSIWAEESHDVENPKFSDFLAFLAKRVDTLESFNTTAKKVLSKTNIKGHIVTGDDNLMCGVCQEKNHSLFQCQSFNAMEVSQRREWAKKNHRCFNCFSNKHGVYKCNSKRRCQNCNKKHHTLLHVVENEESTQSPPTSSSPEAALVQTFCSQGLTDYAILPTALVSVENSNGSISICRALLDSGSQASFITEKCVFELGLKRKNARLSVSGLGYASAGVTKGSVSVTIRPSMHPKIHLEALILPKLASNIPPHYINIDNLTSWRNIQLADPEFFKPNQIDMIIGADHFFNLLENQKIQQGNNGPILQKTKLGWVVSGKVGSQEPQCISSMTASISNADLDKALRRFWEVEMIQEKKNILSPEEQFCEDQYKKSTQTTKQGRFIVSLPFKNSPKNLGHSIDVAIQRLRGVERRFARDPEFFKLYKEFIEEYQELGHMLEIPSHKITNSGCYLPHHGVLKPSSLTTKLRVVFDGSAKTSSGVSLNDCLATGPTVQSTLYSIILRFREHRFAFTADIEKMYRQVLVNENDSQYQKIVWRNSSAEPIRHFRLLTVTYGLAPASFLATRVLQQIADDNESLSKKSFNAIRHNIYVDDLMFGAETEFEMLALKDEINSLLSMHGFNLRKWMSNSEKITDKQNVDNEIEPALSIDTMHEDSKSIKVLGINWIPSTDKFVFTSELSNITSFSKRTVVSEASRLFDPLGWLAPIIVTVKIFIQKLWACNLDWDEPLPVEATKRWDKIRRDLKDVEKLSIPRFIQAVYSDIIELHGFSDASQDAYAAVVYYRIETPNGKVIVSLITAKAKVAPIKQLSVPRLELCASVLLINLINVVKQETQLHINDTYAWTDSKIVLDWLSSHPRRWKSFVGNRTSEILNFSSRKQWGHVSSAENPADCASRGLLPQELQSHDLWWKGPDWLYKSKEFWPPQQNEYGQVTEENNKVLTFNCVGERKWLDILFSRYSSYTKLKKVFAFILRFINNCKPNKAKIKNVYLAREELAEACNRIYRHEQFKFYSDELKSLLASKTIIKSSSLKSLNPFLDESGVIRVGGRLENAVIPYSTRHPIIMHAQSVITTLIIEDIHINSKHSGPSLTLSIARQHFWIPGGRNKIKQIINKCVICTRFKTKVQGQIMGNLPSCRVELIRPFLKVGIDYAGPMPIHLTRGRGQKTYKAYICLFICLSTKAIHLELVSDLTSDSFLGALKRFSARRGLCKEIFSDNGSNFIGANNQLKQAFQKIIRKSNNIFDYSAQHNITWHFNPPSAPHFGGIFEAGVKSAKFHLKRVVGKTILTIEEMNTLLAEIESVLNSRPLCVLNSTDIDALTPSHFLIGHSSSKIPESDIAETKISYLTRWQILQQMAQQFWKRWNTEYLTTLQTRPKWREKKEPLKINDIVVIKEENMPVNQWLLGKVVNVHPGSDGIIRVVTLKTKCGEIKRPIHKLCILPIPT